MAATDFPDDLLQAQVDLDQTRATYERLCRELPWSVDPAPGWSGEKVPYSDYVSSKPDSPGYTQEQKDEVARLEERLRELSAIVAAHPYWGTIEGVVDARMRLKHQAREATTGQGKQ